MADPAKVKLRHPLQGTIVAAVIVGAFCSMKMAAVGLVYVVIFLIFWLPYSLYVIARKPDRRKFQSYKIGIWFLMIAAVLVIHQVRKVYTRDYADSVIHKIEQFHEQQGRYPDSLEELGISKAELKDKLSLAHYSNSPGFYYADTVMVFHMWTYDFRKHEWINQGD